MNTIAHGSATARTSSALLSAKIARNPYVPSDVHAASVTANSVPSGSAQSSTAFVSMLMLLTHAGKWMRLLLSTPQLLDPAAGCSVSAAPTLHDIAVMHSDMNDTGWQYQPAPWERERERSPLEMTAERPAGIRVALGDSGGGGRYGTKGP